jgi:hypothetical protein
VPGEEDGGDARRGREIGGEGEDPLRAVAVSLGGPALRIGEEA